jgi:hypothetical protein
MTCGLVAENIDYRLQANKQRQKALPIFPPHILFLGTPKEEPDGAPRSVNGVKLFQ